MVANAACSPAYRLLSNFMFRLGRRCQLCAAVLDHPEDFPLCPQCAALLAPRLGGYCPRCGDCYADPMAPVYDCLSCRTAPPPWAALGFYGSYSGLLRDLVHRHKFGRDHGLGVILRFMVLQAWRLHALERPDIIVPVPMRPMPVLRRGFNQSAELGRLLAGALGVAFAGQGLLKIRETRAQSSLGRAARMRNVAGAFRAARDVAGRRVLLVDDVMTTGATMRACSRACREAGAARIEVLVLARAS